MRAAPTDRTRLCEAAALEARNQAQFTAHMDRPSEVLVPDGAGKYWIIWTSKNAGAGVPRSAAA